MQQASNTNYNASDTPSVAPILDQSHSSPTQQPTISATDQVEQTADTKSKKRFWQLGKKKEDKNIATTTPNPTLATSTTGLSESSALSQTMASPISPIARQPSSPPRVHSPAESQIFERNVQEESAAVVASPAIPSHIATEDHIPSVLDASSMAITDDHLSPDTVEIVTHAAHLPAAATVVSGPIHIESAISSPVLDENPQSMDTIEEAAPTYAGLDSADIRRLSFISFADVVHGEQAADGTMRDSFHLGSPSSMASPISAGRSPSPIRSSASPTLSAATHVTEIGTGLSLEGNPNRRSMLGSPKSLGASLVSPSTMPTVTGEIAIETMRQALRKTESGDLGAAARSGLGSP